MKHDGEHEWIPNPVLAIAALLFPWPGALAATAAAERTEASRGEAHEQDARKAGGRTVLREVDATPTAVPRQENALAQLRHASTQRQAMRGQAPAERARARAAAVEAYQAVRAHFPEDAATCAESAFRAGELLRAAGAAENALAEFKIARERGIHTPFRMRALLEIGHLERRRAAHAPALAAYEAVLGADDAAAGQRDQAALWIGRIYCDTARPEDARRTWQRVADGAEDPLDRIRAWDGLASLLIESGDLEGAAGTIEQCREALADVSVEETRLGERVRNALTGMRSVDDLARAVAERARREQAQADSSEH